MLATHRSPAFIALLLALLGLSAPALAMRCGTRIVSDGDVQAKVLKYCGEPMQTQQRIGYRTGFFPDLRVRRSLAATSTGGAAAATVVLRHGFVGQTEVIVEEWLYNFGPNKLMRRVTFENGLVVDVQTLGRGFRE